MTGDEHARARWRRVEELCHAALERDVALRASFVRDACGGDQELQHEVESLLAQGSVLNDFLELPKLGTVDVELDPIGRQIGVYRIVSLLGRGGMGEVYRARDTTLGRDVALKVLPSAFAADPDRLSRFRREARLLASLNHPHIGAIYGSEESDGVHAIVLELVEGDTLADRLAKGRLPVDDTLRIAEEIAEALEAAHEKGVIHRDLKPANIKLTPDGHVKVLDFGLAKLAEPLDTGLPVSDLEHSPTITRGGTREGAILGTVAYMSPEQARGTPLDKRTDIWSFGCVVYEMLTGRRAFDGENVADFVVSVMTKEPDWAALPSLTPPRIAELLKGCLKKDPRARLRDIGDARLQIEETIQAPSPVPWTADDARQARRRRATTPAMWIGGVVSLAAVLAFVVAGYFYFHRAPGLTDKDTLVLADFTNTTGDPVFDETLRQGLAVQLEQSPFLSLVSDQRIQRAMRLMGRPADARLTPVLAKEICERTASAAVLEGSIATHGSQYVLGLRAKSCRTGDVLDEEQAQAARKEDVLSALSQIAITFRTRVGESLATVQKHETPLIEATTPSLEALKAYSTALKVSSSTGSAAGVPLLKRAVEIDPQFAKAHATLGLWYSGLGESVLSMESTSKAYQLRDHTSDPERFFITALYDRQVTGNLEKERRTLELWTETYPRDVDAHGLLAGFASQGTGKYEQSIEEAKKAIALDPAFMPYYVNLAFVYTYLDRLKEAEVTLQRPSERKIEIPDLLLLRYYISFLKGDSEGMDRDAALARGKPGAEALMLHSQALVLARSGRLQLARSVARRAVDVAEQAGRREGAAVYETGAAVWEALFGNAPAARRSAMAALELSKGRDVEYGAAFALALAGDVSRSEALANDLDGRFPEDTSVRFSYLPTLRALFALRHGKPSDAIELLQVAVPNELAVPGISFFAFFGSLYPAYVRGKAYLDAHQSAEAATEFQKILDHRGIVFSDPVGAMARLQLGRAFALSGNTARAKTAYQDFLALWKDADSDIPILKQARAEYARLQ
jgi:tetratricopeptide (TPR) repeat protein